MAKLAAVGIEAVALGPEVAGGGALATAEGARHWRIMEAPGGRPDGPATPDGEAATLAGVRPETHRRQAG